MSDYLLSSTKVRVAGNALPALRWDWVAWWLTISSIWFSVISFCFFNRQGAVLAYQDAVSHMEIARRVIDSPTTGFGQLGGVWLPLPHLLMMPFVWSNTLYYDGLAGSLVSMASFVVTTLLLYRIVFDLTGSKLPAVISSLVFMFNLNVLYMQSTPMTELLLFACMAGMVYLVQRWIATDNYYYLLSAGTVAVLGTLTRYEAWWLLISLTAVVIIVSWRKGYGRTKAEGTVIAFLFAAGLGVAGWLTWNLLIFGNALNFQNGEYAKPSLWVGSGEAAVGNWQVALKTYWYAVDDNLHLVSLGLMAVGLVALLVRERLSMRSLPVLSMLTMFPFFVFALEQGQRPLHVTQISGDLYNVRFGLLMVLPASILTGYLTSTFQGQRLLNILLAIVVVAVCWINTVNTYPRTDNIITLKEAITVQSSSYTAYLDGAAAYLNRNYSDGKILMESYGNDSLLFKARVSLVNNIYEGSYKLWEPALADPAGHHITWIVMRHTNDPDKVFLALHDSPALYPYKLVYENVGYYIYKERT